MHRIKNEERIKESYKAMPIVDLVHLYELTAKSIGLEGRRLMLALLISINKILSFAGNQYIFLYYF